MLDLLFDTWLYSLCTIQSLSPAGVIQTFPDKTGRCHECGSSDVCACGRTGMENLGNEIDDEERSQVPQHKAKFHSTASITV